MVKLIRRIIYRWRRWKDWIKLNNNSWLKNILIFLGISKNDWFDNFCDWRRYKGEK